MFVTRICEKLSMSRAIVPWNSSVFSAFGVLTADYVRRYSRTVEWDLRDRDGYLTLNDRRQEMLALAEAEASTDGFAFEDCTLAWSGDLRFQGQVYEVAMDLPDRPFRAEDADDLAGEFPTVYEKQYGKGSSWADSAVLLLNLNLTCSAPRTGPTLHAVEVGEERPAAVAGQRLVSLDGGEPRPVPVVVEAALEPGTTVAGPAIVDLADTTLFVGPSWTCARDAWLNFVLTRDDGS
jgi:N-methylhydantoinase A